MNKPLVISLNGECLKTNGAHTFWSGFDTGGTTRYFAIGKESNTSNRLMISNYTLGETVIQAGSITGNTNLGQNKIITNSNGISLRRGGITLGDTLITVGEIGPTGADNHLYINGNGVNNITINSGIGATNLITNVVWIGSGTANANGRKSNINMLDATGNNWETQSSAFTETLKASIQTNDTRLNVARDFSVNVGVPTGFNAIGRTSLANNTAYGTATTLLDVGVLLNSSYPTLFDSGGSYIGASPARYELLFYNEYLCLNSSVRQCRSRIRIYSSANTNSGSWGDNSGFGGVDYQVNSTLNSAIIYNSAPFKFDFVTGHKIRVETVWMATTSSLGTANTMLGRFYMHRVIY